MELEFLICQYLDGSLEGEPREDLETRLAMDANARQMLADQRQINTLFAKQGLTRDALSARLDNEIDWSQFSRQISVAVASAPTDSAAIEALAPADSYVMPVTVGQPVTARSAIPRKLSVPGFSYRGLSFRAVGSLAVAACLLVAMGTVARFYLTRTQQPKTVGLDQGSVAVLSQVVGPQVETSQVSGVSEVSIGPGKSLGGTAMVVDESDDLVARPSRVVIASGINPEQDRTGLPY